MANTARAFFLFAVVSSLAIAGDSVEARPNGMHWVGSWSAAQQLVESSNALAPEDLRDATLRQVVHLSLGGSELRLRISNRYGSEPLHLTAVHIARSVSSGTSKIDPATDTALTFSSSQDVRIPQHAEYVSDPMYFPVTPLSDLAITFHLDSPVAEQTGHPGSRATSYFAHGNAVSAAELPDAHSIDHWYFIAGIDLSAPCEAASIVVLGDSITDGRGSATNANNRWTDLLANRMQSRTTTRQLAILNEGIGGNRILTDGLGQNALARFDTDVLARPGVRFLIILEGINDIGMLTHFGDVPREEHDSLVQRLVAAYQQMIALAHANGIKVIGGTLLPFGGSEYYRPSNANESDRGAVNAWIRTPGHFDAILDFDKITADPHHPDQLLPALDSGDHLHPHQPVTPLWPRQYPLLYSRRQESTDD